MASPLALSVTAQAVISTIGAEGGPLVVVDDALADPVLVRAIAARQTYRPIGPHYPGLRAPVPEAVAMELVDPLAGVVKQVFAVTAAPRFTEGFLSLVTTPPEQLTPIQRLPHFDGVEPTLLAALLYLDPAATAGTAFYRQRSTGFESVTADRFDSYERHLHADAARHGLPAAGYIGGDTPLFEQVGQVEGRFNRLVIYRGNQLHCASLPAGFAPVADPLRGRLTLNLFLRC